MDGTGEDMLLAEQVEYYRAVAEEYFDGLLDEPGATELTAAIDAFAPAGDVLELASGPGTWTPQRRAGPASARPSVDRRRRVPHRGRTHRRRGVDDDSTSPPRRHTTPRRQGAPHPARTRARTRPARLGHPGPPDQRSVLLGRGRSSSRVSCAPSSRSTWPGSGPRMTSPRPTVRSRGSR